jgi:hypothetical protein
MSQGVKNRKAGEVFIDQENNDEYIISEIRIFSGNDYDDLINNINAVFDTYKIVNRKDVTPNTRGRKSEIHCCFTIRDSITTSSMKSEKREKYYIISVLKIIIPSI